MPKRDEAYMEGRRKVILAAAWKCIARSGLSGASTDEICREAGISLGSLYTHFKSKDDIVLGLTQQHTGEVREAMSFTSLDEAKAKFLSRIKHFSGKRFAASVRVEVQLLAAATSSETVHKALGENFDAAREGIYTSIGALQATGEIRADISVAAAGAMLTNFVYGALYLQAVRTAEAAADMEVALCTLIESLRA
jgi:AcrR family transcriptional regulator